MEFNQRIQLKKEGSEQSISYENNNTKIYRSLNEDEYYKLFNKLKPNIDFSLPDRLIQSFVKDGTILPSYKKSPLFTPEDFDSIIQPLRSELPFLSKMQNGIKRNRRNNLPKLTKKKRKINGKKVKFNLKKLTRQNRNKRNTKKRAPPKKKSETKNKKETKK